MKNIISTLKGMGIIGAVFAFIGFFIIAPAIPIVIVIWVVWKLFFS